MKRDRRFLVLLIVLFSAVVQVFAVTQTTTKILSAFKQHMSGNNVEPVVDIRFNRSSDSSTIEDNSAVFVSTVSESMDLGVFSWVMSGNTFGSVQLEFTFAPFVSVIDSSKKIGYSITLSHGSSKTGNRLLPVNSDADQSVPVQLTIYDSESAAVYCDVYYADTISVSAGSNATTSALTATCKTFTKSGSAYNYLNSSCTFSYNLSTRTVALSSNNHANNVKSSIVDAGVCTFWNRSGSASISVDKNSITGGADGEFLAAVAVAITVD